jgi:hypothetical protein
MIFTLMLSGDLILNSQALGEATLTLSPSNFVANQPNETFTLSIEISDVSDLWSWAAVVTWNPQVISLAKNPIEGGFLTQVGYTIFLPDASQGNNALYIMSQLFGSEGANGSGILATLTFKITEPVAYSPINLANASLLSAEPDPNVSYAHLTILVNVPQPSATVSLFTGTGPLANAGDAQIVNEDTPMMFNASKTVPITNGTQFRWTFDDSGPRELDGMTPTYTFDIPGVHEVLLTVTDEQGLRSNATVAMTVRDTTPPVAVITLRDANTKATINPGQAISVGQLIDFEAYSRSYDPENGTLQLDGYTWDMGDGTI